MTHPRGLTPDEAALWEKVSATVTPLKPVRPARATVPRVKEMTPTAKPPQRNASPKSVNPPKPAITPKPATPERGLDSHWDRRLKGGSVQPDFTLDLHGHSLDAAYVRLMDGIAQARSMDARTILLIAGRDRREAPADRAGKRGAIRAKVLDWLAASPHHSAIAAVRKAHIRHGGEGALYVVLKRQRT